VSAKLFWRHRDRIAPNMGVTIAQNTLSLLSYLNNSLVWTPRPSRSTVAFMRFWLHTHSRICKNAKNLPSDRRAELHRELNRQEEDFEVNVRPALDAADAAFKKRYDARIQPSQRKETKPPPGLSQQAVLR
jgi:hypothetical protein